MIRGAVDSVTCTEINGWAYATGQRTGLTIQALLNHELIGEAKANIHRPDLKQAGLGDGSCGFTINLHREIDPAYLPFVSIRPEHGDVELPRSTVSGYSEFFQVVHRRFPLAGRQRSVYGGLWTDRTDAAALLQGRLTLKTVDRKIGELLFHLINAGYQILELGLQVEPIHRDIVAEVFQDAQLVALLQAVLEDTPVVLRSLGPSIGLMQPSSNGASISPTECLAVVLPTRNPPVILDIVRDSHKLPEFNQNGVSRWVRQDGDALSTFAEHENFSVHRETIPAGAVAVVGSGTLYRLSGDGMHNTVVLTCVPSRALPAHTALSDDLVEEVLTSDIRLYRPR